MRLVTFEQHGSSRVGAVRGNAGHLEVVDLCSIDASLPITLKSLLESGAGALARAAEAAASGVGVPLTSVTVKPPIVDPQKIICIGLNYADHAAETGAKVGDEP